MREHFGLSVKQYNELLCSDISVQDLFHAVKEFNAENSEVSKVSLMYYADKHGDFLEDDANKKTDLIAKAVFENLDIKEKIEVAEYIEYLKEESENEE